MMRHDVTTHFFETVRSLVNGRCCPVVQFDADKTNLPAIVYYALGSETVTTFDGPFETATALRYECRAKDYDDATELSQKVLARLRDAGRLLRIGAGIDNYDEALAIYRRIQSVTIGR